MTWNVRKNLRMASQNFTTFLRELIKIEIKFSLVFNSHLPRAKYLISGDIKKG